MEDFSIERAGIANLDFTGDLIGQGGSPVVIKIYRTKGNKYVGETNANLKMAQAEHFDTPAALISWFKNRPYGITREIQDAIEDAANHDDLFKAAWNVQVD